MRGDDCPCGRGRRGDRARRGQPVADPDIGEKVAGAPFEVKRDWGTFKLADRIAAKVKAGDKINYVFSYQASGIPLVLAAVRRRISKPAARLGKAIYPLDCASIAPVQTDAIFNCGAIASPTI